MLPVELLTKILFKVNIRICLINIRNKLLNNILIGKLYKTKSIDSKDYIKSNYKIKIYKINVCRQDYMDVLNNLHKNIIYLDVSWNNISDEEIKELFLSLTYIPKLSILNLSSNNISNDGLKELSQNLKYIPNLTQLNLSYNNISYEGIKELSQNLKYIPNLTILGLSCNNISNDGLKELSQNLKYISKLTRLSLIYNGISNEGLIELSQNLKYIPNLTILGLNCNNISYKVIKYLLSKQINLSRLGLSDNYPKLEKRYPHITFIN